MLVITAEVWPGGNYTGARRIGTVAAANVTGLADVSDYVAVAMLDAGDRRALWVPGHRRSDGWASLTARALTGSGCEPLKKGWDEFAATVAARVEAVLQR